MKRSITYGMLASACAASLLAACGGNESATTPVPKAQSEILGQESKSSAAVASCTVQAEDYAAFNDTTPGNSGGQYRTDAVDIEATSDTGGGFDIGWTAAGEWLTHPKITFPSTGAYTIKYRVAAPAAGGVISADLNAGSIQLGTTAVPTTGGWQTWTTVQRTINVNAGTYDLGTYVSAGGFNLNWISIEGASCGGTSTPPPVPGGWTLAWADEFNATSLDASKWNIEVNGDGGGNNELQYYTARPENVRLSGGNLIIEARKEAYGGKQYTSGRITTQNKASWKFGRMEARMKIPTGKGTWPAFWMLGSSLGNGVPWPSSGEIDIMEHVNTEANIYGTIHWSDPNNNHASYGNPSGSLDFSQYHVYAVEWDTNTIRWFVDGVQFNEANIAGGINGTSEFQSSFFLLFNLAVGGQWPGSPDASTAFPNQMLVDYVRVYRK